MGLGLITYYQLIEYMRRSLQSLVRSFQLLGEIGKVILFIHSLYNNNMIDF